MRGSGRPRSRVQRHGNGDQGALEAMVDGLRAYAAEFGLLQDEQPPLEGLQKACAALEMIYTFERRINEDRGRPPALLLATSALGTVAFPLLSTSVRAVTKELLQQKAAHRSQENPCGTGSITASSMAPLDSGGTANAMEGERRRVYIPLTHLLGRLLCVLPMCDSPHTSDVLGTLLAIQLPQALSRLLAAATQHPAMSSGPRSAPDNLRELIYTAQDTAITYTWALVAGTVRAAGRQLPRSTLPYIQQQPANTTTASSSSSSFSSSSSSPNLPPGPTTSVELVGPAVLQALVDSQLLEHCARVACEHVVSPLPFGIGDLPDCNGMHPILTELDYLAEELDLYRVYDSRTEGRAVGGAASVQAMRSLLSGQCLQYYMALHVVSQLHAANAYASNSSSTGTGAHNSNSCSMLHGLPPGALLRPAYSDGDEVDTKDRNEAGTMPVNSADAAQLSAMGLYGMTRLWLWGRQQQPPVQLLPYSPAAVFQLCVCLTDTVLRLREDAARRAEQASRSRKGTVGKRGAAGAAAAAAWDSQPEQSSTLTSLPLALNAVACAAVMLPAYPCRVDQDRYAQEARGALLLASVVQETRGGGAQEQASGEEERHVGQAGTGAEAVPGPGPRAGAVARLARWWGCCLRAVAAVAAQGLTAEREETLRLATHLLTLNTNRAALATAGVAGSAVAGARAFPVLSLVPTRLPPAPPRNLAAALSAGYVPCLERFLRQAQRACDTPQRAALLLSPLADGETLLHLLSYGDVREVAALVATVGKLLDRVEKAERVASEWPVLLMRATCSLVHALSNMRLAQARRRMKVRRRVHRNSQAQAQQQGEGSPAAAGRAGGSSSATESAGTAYQDPDPGARMRQAGLLGSIAVALWAPRAMRLMLENRFYAMGQLSRERLVGELLRMVGVLVRAHGHAVERDGEDGAAAASWRGLLLGRMGLPGSLEPAVAWLAGRAVTPSPALVAPLEQLALGFPVEMRAALGEAGETPLGRALRTFLSWSAEGSRGKRLLEALEALRACRCGEEEFVLDGLRGDGAGWESEGEVEGEDTGALGFACWRASLLCPPCEVVAELPLRLCAFTGCASLEGDSEAGLSLVECSGGCGAVSYCSRRCQEAHWKGDHRHACMGRGGGG